MNRWEAICLTCALCVSVAAQAQTFSTLVNFSGANGSQPSSPLVQGFDGNLYGATSAGGIYSNCSGIGGCGTIYSTTTDGALTTLHNFCPSSSSCLYGRTPGSTVVLDPSGDFYGTTPFGGSSNWGEVYRITANGVTFARIYSFCALSNCTDGQNPGGLLRASDENLYGVTTVGGAHGQGTVFKMSRHGTLTTLYNFCSLANCADGQEPSGIIQANDGNLFGLTFAGGASNSRGTIFKITSSGTLTTLYIFCAQGGTDCPDGAYPSGLFQAADGDLYGTSSGGTNNNGTVFRISPSGTFKSLYTFCSQVNCADGFGPTSLIQATDGNFYGTTGGGGASNEGTIFQLTPSGVFTKLYDFCPQVCANNPSPGGLVQHTDGNFYGLTLYGGSSANCGAAGCGTVFKLSTGFAPFVKIVVPQGTVGSSVIILGTNLTGATGVTFNAAAANFTVVSATEIVATVPIGASTGKIQVVTPSATLLSSATFRVLP